MRVLFVIAILFGIVAQVAASGDPAIAEARADLAQMLKIPEDDIRLIIRQQRDWPDRSMGCPRKGMSYAQVITNGSQLIFEANGKQYAYHAGNGGAYFYCASPWSAASTGSE